jgi:GAF domain-containing protein
MQADTQTLRNFREENIRLKDEIHHLRVEVRRLQDIIRALNTLQYNIDAITSETDVITLIHNILSTALVTVGTDNGSLLLIDEAINQLVFVDVIGPSHDALLGYRMPADEGVAGWVVTNKSPVLIADVDQDQRWSSNVDQSIGFHTSSLIGVPLLDGDRPLGIIEVVNAVGSPPFVEGDLDIMMLVARLASLVLVQAEKSAV